MKKIIVITMLLVILGAKAVHGDGEAYRLWQEASNTEKQIWRAMMIEGYRGAIYLIGRPSENIVFDLIPDIPMEEFSKEIMYRMELKYLKEDCRDMGIIFARAILEAYSNRQD